MIVSAEMSMLEVATRYRRRGWMVVPAPFQSKRVLLDDWPRLRLSEEDLPQHFNGHPQNIGILTGEPSAWLIDIDLDHELAIQWADQYLPPTGLIFGRASKPRSHRFYRVTSPVATKKHKSRSAGMIVELRSTGAQTIVPPSVHESGEPIEWEDEHGEPALLDPEVLLAAVNRLGDAVLVELGEKTAKCAKPERPRLGLVAPFSPQDIPLAERAKRCVAAMLRLQISDARDGSGRLYAVACRAVEHDLDDAMALKAIRDYAAQRPFPKHWSDDDILRRVRDAEERCQRGRAFNVQLDEEGLVPLGERDPMSGRLVLSPRRTLPTARAFVSEFYENDQGQTLHSYAGSLIGWRDNRYVALEDGQLKQRLHPWLHEAQRYTVNRAGETLLTNFDANPASVNAALETIRSHCHVPATLRLPAWLSDDPALPKSTEIVALRSGLLHLPTMRLLDPTPQFFTNNALEFDYEPDAPSPGLWLRFLHELFDGDVESLDLLQEWMGYCLTGDTGQQKMLLVVGPRRSGKGTMARVFGRLIGDSNVCGPTTGGLAGAFGLQPLLGKSLAIVSDARFSGDRIATVVERLLCISGEDMLTIDRKYQASVTLKLPVRFMFLSNEMPRLTDASGALAGRFLILRLTRSFYGQEDQALTDKLLAELPGILNWAIEGWQRLRERGHFVMPSAVVDSVRQLEDLASPVKAFVRDYCVVGPDQRVFVDELYAAWKSYCEDEGRRSAGTKQTFGKDLQASEPSVLRRRNHALGRFYEGIGLRGATHVPVN